MTSQCAIIYAEAKAESKSCRLEMTAYYRLYCTLHTACYMVALAGEMRSKVEARAHGSVASDRISTGDVPLSHGGVLVGQVWQGRAQLAAVQTL